MKKLVMLLAAILVTNQLILCMDNQDGLSGALGRLGQTIYDKLDPTIVINELTKNGISPDPREKMTQAHRVDRVIRYYIERKETEKLCDSVQQIIAQQWPFSSIAQEMTLDYLWKLRPSIRKNKPLLNGVTTALDLLNPAQVIDDIQKGQLYSDELIDLETRVNRIMERLVKSHDAHNLKQLIDILLQKNQKQSATNISPNNRVLQLAYQFLRTQEKQDKQYKKILVTTFKVEKNKSDTEEDEKEKDEKKENLL